MFCTRIHDFCAAHRLVGHAGACANLHGHNYRVHFTLSGAKADEKGMLIDFGEIKETFCKWIDDNWDHRTLLWERDPLAKPLQELDDSVVIVSFNPTAENMADWLLQGIGTALLGRWNEVHLARVTIDETRKCSATSTGEPIPWTPSDNQVRRENGLPNK